MKTQTDKQTDQFTAFRSDIAANVKTTIGKLKRSGTVAMSERNLLQVTPTPRTSQGPIGTNAQFVYAQMFSEVIKTLPAKLQQFIY